MDRLKMTTACFTYVPGKGATEFFQTFSEGNLPCDLHFYHEEIAYTVAHGASLVGRPALVFVKSHGIAKAMNSVIASLYAGISAPFVIFTFEDESGTSSDHPFSSFKMLEGVSALVLRADIESLHSIFREALTQSLQKKMPVFISLSTQTLPDSGAMKALKKIFSDFLGELSDPPVMLPYQALLNPLLSPRYLAPLSRIPRCPEDLPPHLKKTAERYEPAIRVLEQIGYDWVTGDAGTSSLFGLPPHDLINVCTHMGGAIPLALGAALAGKQRVLAITGDFSFLSTGNLALTEALRRNVNLDVVVFCNGVAAATGGQVVNLDTVLKAIPRELNPTRVELSKTHLDPDLFSTPPTGLRVFLLQT